jgi:hypothetical protein
MLLETDTLGRVKPIVSFAALSLLILDTHPVKGPPRQDSEGSVGENIEAVTRSVPGKSQ